MSVRAGSIIVTIEADNQDKLDYAVDSIEDTGLTLPSFGSYVKQPGKFYLYTSRISFYLRWCLSQINLLTAVRSKISQLV